MVLFLIGLSCSHCCISGKPKYQASRVQPLEPQWGGDRQQTPQENTALIQDLYFNSQKKRNVSLHCQGFLGGIQRNFIKRRMGPYSHDISSSGIKSHINGTIYVNTVVRLITTHQRRGQWNSVWALSNNNGWTIRSADMCLNVTLTVLWQIKWFDILLIFSRNVTNKMEKTQTFKLVQWICISLATSMFSTETCWCRK